jgi:hypothetical protein
MEKVSTKNPSGGSSYRQILQSASVPHFIVRMGG